MATNGIAIVIPNADFSAKNLGKVTFTSLPNLQALEIVADDIYNHTEKMLDELENLLDEIEDREDLR